MIARFLNILVAGIILACPYVCRLRPPATVTGGMPPPSCCGCCHESSSANHSSAPGKPGQIPQQRPRQCICGGAVFEQVPQLDSPFNIGWWIDPLAPVVLPTRVALSDFFAYVTVPPPTGAINSGRALCLLHMSLLC